MCCSALDDMTAPANHDSTSASEGRDAPAGAPVAAGPLKTRHPGVERSGRLHPPIPRQHDDGLACGTCGAELVATIHGLAHAGRVR